MRSIRTPSRESNSVKSSASARRGRSSNRLITSFVLGRNRRSVQPICGRRVAPRQGRGSAIRVSFISLILRVALQKLDGNALRSADEADAHARADGLRLLGERHALRLQLRGNGVDVLDRQAEMIE